MKKAMRKRRTKRRRKSKRRTLTDKKVQMVVKSKTRWSVPIRQVRLSRAIAHQASVRAASKRALREMVVGQAQQARR